MYGATTTRVVHLEANRADEGLCGDVKVQTTPDPACVTCRRCITRMGGAAPEPIAGTELPYLTRGAHTLGGYEHRLAATRLGDALPRGPRWDSLAKAGEHWARVVDDGAPIRSSFRSEAPVQTGFSGDRGVGGREDVLAFTVALEEAFERDRHFGAAVVSVELQRMILEARLCGVPQSGRVAPGRKGTITKRVPITAAELAELLLERAGLELTVHQVGVIYRDGMRAMRERLERVGELRPMRRREAAKNDTTTEDEMAIGEWDLEGWQEISDAVGRSVRTCQEYASREVDPLPCRFMLGRVVAKRADINAWLTNQATRQGKSRLGAA